MDIGKIDVAAIEAARLTPRRAARLAAWFERQLDRESMPEIAPPVWALLRVVRRNAKGHLFESNAFAELALRP
jgi:hypothetical protein|nr:hypothetical protein [Sinorhizobium meliloti]